MAINELYFGLHIASALLLLLSLVFIIKNREYEQADFESSVNAILFGVFFLFIISIMNILTYADILYHDALVSFTGLDTTLYIGYLANIVDLALIPLFAICILVGIIFAKDNFEEQET